MSINSDALLQRRPIEFYIGKVLWVKGAMVPQGYPEGYYIPLRVNAQGNYDYHFIGTVRPDTKEPIYIHDGLHRDLRAIPSTVRPPNKEWIIWPALFVAIVIFMSFAAIDGGGFWAIICLPVLAVPFYVWYMNIEPVRGTKTSMVVLGTAAVLMGRHEKAAHEWEKSKETWGA